MNIAHIRRIACIVSFFGMLSLLAPLGVSAAQPDDAGSPVGLSRVALAHQVFDAIFNGNDPTEAAFLLSEDATIHTPYGDFTGPHGLQAYLDLIKRAYPDAAFDITGVSVQGDTIEVSWTMSASRYQIGPTEPPLDVDVTMTGTSTITVAGVRITDMAQTSDELVVAAPRMEAASVTTTTEGGCVYGPCIP